MYPVEGVRMLLSQGSLSRFRHLFRQLQRILPSMHLAVCECKLSSYSLTIFAYIAEMGYPIVPTAETSIDLCQSSLSASLLPLAFRLKVP